MVVLILSNLRNLLRA